MNTLIDDTSSQRQSERRDLDGGMLSEAERRGLTDRRSDDNWRHNWLRERIRRSLRD